MGILRYDAYWCYIFDRYAKVETRVPKRGPLFIKGTDMEKQSLKNLEEALKSMQENNAFTPHTHSYIESLLGLIHGYRNDEEENLESLVEQIAVDTVSLLQFFDTRLTVLESGKPTPKW